MYIRIHFTKPTSGLNKMLIPARWKELLLFNKADNKYYYNSAGEWALLFF